MGLPFSCKIPRKFTAISYKRKMIKLSTSTSTTATMLNQIVLLLCLLLANNLVFCQQKSQQKCREFLNAPKATVKQLALSIVGGTLAERNEFPHMVALGYGPKNNRQWLCGGSIISENYILTAAHCTSNAEFGAVNVARMGIKHLKNEKGIDNDVDRIIKHPNYKSPSQYNDIALLRLKQKIIFSSSIFPVCLNTIFDVKPKNKLITTGWGDLSFGGSPSDTLMKVGLKLYSYRECQSKYKSISANKLARGINHSTQICAGGELNEEKDSCQGDSGGPLVLKNGQFYTLVGITSFGKACGVPNIPAVYTRVSAFVPWIEKHVWN